MKQNNDIPQGYKDSPLGIIPLEWEVKKLGEISDIDKDSLSNTTSNNYEFDYISLSDVDSEDFKIETTKQIFGTAPSRARRIVKQGDILMSTVRPNLQGFTIIKNEVKDLIASTGFAVITTKSCNNAFLFNYLFSNKLSKQLDQLLVGSNYPAINSSDVKNLRIPLPPLPEQQKIAEILSTWDNAIEKQNQLIDKLETRKRGLMQQLLTGKKRLKGFEGAVTYTPLKSFLHELSERNRNNNTTVLSVTNSRGFISQEEQFDRIVASTDLSNYKIVRKGQFAYNPSRVNVGSLDLLQTFREGLLSPMYVVFKTDETKLLSIFLYYQLKSSWFTKHIPLFVQGSVRDSLSFDGLCAMKFFIPSIEEQTAIVNILSTVDKEINLAKKRLAGLKEQKKGLMQGLLTGNRRVLGIKTANHKEYKWRPDTI